MSEIDNNLIAKASHGDKAAFEEIYRVTSKFVYNVALRVINDSKDAEEITQDVYIKIYKNLKHFAFRSSFKTWIYRIAVNTAINFKRRRARRTDYESVLDKEAVQAERDYTSEGLVDYLLGKLSPEHRVCIVLKEIQDLSYREISDVLRLNINTVRSRLKRARQRLTILRKEVVENGL